MRLLLIAVWLFSTPYFFGQTESAWTFSSFNTDATKLSFRFPANSAEHTAIASIASSLRNMEARYNGKFGSGADTVAKLRSNLSEPFVLSMEDDLQTFNNLPADPEAKLRTLQALAEDLRIKDQFSATLMAAVSSSFPHIISVRFVLNLPANSNLQASNLTTLVNSCAHKTSPPGDSVGNGKGPFDKTMAPGCFTVWVQNASTILHVYTVKIGDSGKTSEIISLPLD